MTLSIYAGLPFGGSLDFWGRFDGREEAQQFTEHLKATGLDPWCLDNSSMFAHARAWARKTGREWRRFVEAEASRG